MGVISTRLLDLGIVLPSITAPSGSYIPYRFTGNLLYISGQIPRINGIDHFLGIVGESISVADGYRAARLCGLNLMARVCTALEGDLDRVSSCVQLRGFVNARPDFKEHPAVIDGASDLLIEILGDNGRHVRTALGVGSLPRGCSVEIDAVFEVAANS